MDFFSLGEILGYKWMRLGVETWTFTLLAIYNSTTPYILMSELASIYLWSIKSGKIRQNPNSGFFLIIQIPESSSMKLCLAILLYISDNVYGYEISEPVIIKSNPLFRFSYYGMQYKIELSIVVKTVPVGGDTVVFMITTGKGAILCQIISQSETSKN